MTWQDYKQKKQYKYLAIGLLDGIYVLERKIQSGMASDFYKLSQAEYDEFDTWCNDERKLNEIRMRSVWMRGFFQTSEFRKM